MKKRVAVIYGGQSTEHEVSLVSARSIISNLDSRKYTVLPILIEKNGSWILEPSQDNPKKRPLTSSSQDLPDFASIAGKPLDVIFPVLHGHPGEDGTIQGVFELTGVPYVGCGILASALCMDKIVQKELCANIGIPLPKYAWFTLSEWLAEPDACLKKLSHLAYPLFVKPANQGSSIGVSKVKSESQLQPAIELSLKLTSKVIIEEGVRSAREIECSVLGNDTPQVSVLGEIIPNNEFYDYNAKYLDGKSQEVIPAQLNSSLTTRIRETALLAYKTLSCSGLARVDFLVEGESGNFFLHELNTMPGFTPISMYPKLWEASGLPYPKLLDILIDLALERHQQNSKLIKDYQFLLK